MYITPRQLRNDLARDSDQKSFRQMRFRAARSKRQEYCETLHKYVLKVGAETAANAVEMLGLEAVQRNKAFEDEFWKALGRKERGARLSRWCLADRSPDRHS